MGEADNSEDWSVEVSVRFVHSPGWSRRVRHVVDEATLVSRRGENLVLLVELKNTLDQGLPTWKQSDDTRNLDYCGGICSRVPAAPLPASGVPGRVLGVAEVQTRLQ